MDRLSLFPDISTGDTGLRRAILQKLEDLYPGVYSYANVAHAGTHSHAGIGGYPENLLPQLTSLGFVRETFDAIVTGRLTDFFKKCLVHLINTTRDCQGSPTGSQ